MSEPWSSVFPESLAFGTRKEAKVWVHGGCGYCERIWKEGRKLKGWKYVWNTKTRDLVALVPP